MIWKSVRACRECTPHPTPSQSPPPLPHHPNFTWICLRFFSRALFFHGFVFLSSLSFIDSRFIWPPITRCYTEASAGLCVRCPLSMLPTCLHISGMAVVLGGQLRVLCSDGLYGLEHGAGMADGGLSCLESPLLLSSNSLELVPDASLNRISAIYLDTSTS